MHTTPVYRKRLMCSTPFFLFLSVFVLLGAMSDAQVTGYYSGRIIDSRSRDPLAGIRVCALSGIPCTVTDADGHFRLGSHLKIDSLLFDGLGYHWIDEAYNENAVFEGKSFTVTYGIVQDPFEMSSVQIVAFNNRKTNASTPGTFGIVSNTVLNGNDQSSLQNALNTIPGVEMESRGYGGSQRINIRGSFLRSPFAIRNVKIYLDGIPLSSPDGTSPLELIDASDIENIEVIKGPAGSVWGSGIGGVLLLNGRRPILYQSSLRHSELVGEYGFYRSLTSSEISKGKFSLRVSHNYQQNAGYRKQEFNRKQQVSLFAGYNLSEKISWLLYGTYYNGQWALPGSLNADEAKENPTMANLFSKKNNASVYRERITTGVSQTWKISGRMKNVTALYQSTTQKYNPYGTSPFSNGFKDEAANGWGGRTEFSGNIIARQHFEWKTGAGAEIQWEHFDITETENDGGLPGTHKYSYLTKYKCGFGFITSDLSFFNRLFLTSSVSANKTIHVIDGYGADYFPSDTTAAGNIVLLPRTGISIRIDSLIFLHGSISSGISQPTVFEQLDVQYFNTLSGDFIKNSIAPERGINYEGGMKGTEYRTGVQLEITLYDMELRNAILPYSENIYAMGDTIEITRYSNSGATRQRGLEASLRKTFFRREGKGMNALELWTNLSHTFNTFGNYILESMQLENNYLPGTPRNTGSSGITVRAWNHRFVWNLTEYWFDKAPLNVENTVWSSPYHLINTRIDFHFSDVLNLPLNVDIFAGGNNLLNISYTSFYQLNATDGRYYNPSPLLNFYGGIGVKWTF
ncbi:MAG: TonB-dependent receptor plug domain-containing protein [Crocinitomicaceae bacterium]|nr:TonB-dependent receptor plug domain-containing protein [Crocinitomicaceae bacterium]